MNNRQVPSPPSPRGQSPGLLDGLIILFASAAILLFLFWLATALNRNPVFTTLPTWVASAFSSVWGAITSTALGVVAALVRAFKYGPTPHPNYIAWILGVVIALIVLVWFLTKIFPPQPDSTRALLGTFNKEAGGCQSVAQSFSAAATGRLDTAHGGSGGAPAGFDFERSGNGNHGIRGISASGNTVTFELHAEGGGSRGMFNACNGASGANSAVTVHAWVFPT